MECHDKIPNDFNQECRQPAYTSLFLRPFPPPAIRHRMRQLRTQAVCLEERPTYEAWDEANVPPREGRDLCQEILQHLNYFSLCVLQEMWHGSLSQEDVLYVCYWIVASVQLPVCSQECCYQEPAVQFIEYTSEHAKVNVNSDVLLICCLCMWAYVCIHMYDWQQVLEICAMPFMVTCCSTFTHAV